MGEALRIRRAVHLHVQLRRRVGPLSARMPSCTFTVQIPLYSFRGTAPVQVPLHSFCGTFTCTVSAQFLCPKQHSCFVEVQAPAKSRIVPKPKRERRPEGHIVILPLRQSSPRPCCRLLPFALVCGQASRRLRLHSGLPSSDLV